MESKGYFDHVASDWDNMRSGFFSDNLSKKALVKAGVTENQTAVDIGAGTGFLANELLKAGLEVIAIDESVKMLEVLRDKFGAKINIREGGAENLPVEDNSVDYVFANMLLHHVENPPVAINEFYRVLKPDGKLVITDLDKHEEDFLRIEQNDRWMGFERQDITTWFERAGLKDIEINCADEECCTQSEAAEKEVQLSIFLAYGKK